MVLFSSRPLFFSCFEYSSVGWLHFFYIPIQFLLIIFDSDNVVIAGFFDDIKRLFLTMQSVQGESNVMQIQHFKQFF